ncbi:MAG: stage II sporulation protein M [archaeon]
MIESLFNPKMIREKATKRWEIFIAGFIFTVVAVLFAINVIPPVSGVTGLGFLIVAFICIPAAPFFVQLFKIEEKEEFEKCKYKVFSKNLFTRHLDVIGVFAFFFLAIVFASSLIYVVVPEETSNNMFSDQVSDLRTKGVLTGEATGAFHAGESESNGESILTGASFGLGEIILNNFTVLSLAFLFSFVFGAGAVFLISWNASIIGVLIGKIAENPGPLGLIDTGNIFTNYLIALPVTILRLLPHGIFEFGAYFIGAVAGGVLSAGVIQESIKERRTNFKHLKPVIIDSCVYLGIAFGLVIMGAIVEILI